MQITIEYIYKCRHCGQNFHDIVNGVEVDASQGAEKTLTMVKDSLVFNSKLLSSHQCLDGRVIGLGDLQGAYPYEKRGG